jgi:hypothetical protein
MPVATLNTSLLRTKDQCPFYRQERDYETDQVRKYDRLIFAIAVAVAASLAALVIAISANLGGASAASGIATLVTGGGAVFLFNQRTDHRERRAEWIKLVDENCG